MRLGRHFHERPIPAFADADADITHAVRYPFSVRVIPAITECRNAGADMDEIWILRLCQERPGGVECLAQIERPDEMALLQICEGVLDIIRTHGPQLGVERHRYACWR